MRWWLGIGGALLVGGLALYSSSGPPPAPVLPPPSPVPPARQVGDGPPFVRPETVKPDGAEHVLVIDPDGNKVLRVALRDGARTVLYDPQPRKDVNPRDAQRGPDGALYVLVELAETEGGRLVRAEDGAVLSEPGARGAGPSWRKPYRLELAAGGGFYVMEEDGLHVYRVDASTGDRTVVATPPLPEVQFGDLATSRDGDLLLLDREGSRVYRLAGSGLELLVDLLPPRGDALFHPVGLDVDAEGRLLLTQADLCQLWRVDPRSGALERLVGAAVAGAALAIPMDVLGMPDGSALVVCSRGPNVVRVRPGSPPSVLSGGNPTDVRPSFRPFSLGRDGDGLLFVDPEQRGVGRFDPATGRARWLARGGELRFPRGVAPAGDAVLVSDLLQGFVRVDRATGAMTGLGSPPPREGRPVALLGLPDGRILALDTRQKTLAFVDPKDGSLTPLPWFSDFEWSWPQNLAPGRDGDHVLVNDFERNVLVEAQLSTGRLEVLVENRDEGALDADMLESATWTPEGRLYVGEAMEGAVLLAGPAGLELASGWIQPEGDIVWVERGAGPRLVSPWTLLPLGPGRLLVGDMSAGNLIEVDLATAQRRFLPMNWEPAPRVDRVP